jgi:hypothetical protein
LAPLGLFNKIRRFRGLRGAGVEYQRGVVIPKAASLTSFKSTFDIKRFCTVFSPVFLTKW